MKGTERKRPCARSLAAALGLGRHGGGFPDQLSGHDARDEELGAVIVKINRRAFLIGRGHNSEPVDIVLDGVAFLHYLHRILLGTLGHSLD